MFNVDGKVKNSAAISFKKYARRPKTRPDNPKGYRKGWDEVFMAECPEHGPYRKSQGCEACEDRSAP